MPSGRILFLLFTLVWPFCAESAGVLVLRFHNSSSYADVDWVGEGISETLRAEFSAADQIVIDRDSRTEGMRRLALRPAADFTKATIIKLGQTLDVDYVCYGSYEITGSATAADLKNSSVRIDARFIDLRKMRDGPELSEAGKLSELSRQEEHLAWQSLAYLDPDAKLPLERFLSPQKLVRLDAQESYVRGLLSSSGDQQQKWFTQAAVLDSHFSSPAFELGKLSLARHDYKQALSWLTRIPASDPLYEQARFKMGLGAYGMADYTSASNYFHEVLKKYPLNEIYNNVAAAESRLNLAAAIDDFRHALEGDSTDPVYLFNLGGVLVQFKHFEEAAKWLQAELNQKPDDEEARKLLDDAKRTNTGADPSKPAFESRLKQNFDETAFRQLRSMVQPKGSN